MFPNVINLFPTRLTAVRLFILTLLMIMICLRPIHTHVLRGSTEKENKQIYLPVFSTASS